MTIVENKARDKKLAQVMKNITQMVQRTPENGFTQAETEEAAAKMSGLMLKFNITMGDLNAHAQKTQRKVASQAFDLYPDRWRVDLLYSTAEAYLCKAIRHFGGKRPKNRTAMDVVGHEHNLVVVRSTWEWLTKEATRQARAAHKAAVADGDITAVMFANTWKTSYCTGFSVGISQAFAAMKTAVEAEVTSAQWAMVAVLDGEVDTRFDELYPESRLYKAKTRKVMGTPYENGKDAGRKTNVASRQMSGSAPTAALA